MNKLEKGLRRLSQKERSLVAAILQQMQRHDFSGLAIKKLKGVGNIYRVRKQSIRIIYSVDPEGAINLLSVSRRSEKTYRL